MTPSIRNRTIALAALFQCVELVRQIAWQGQAAPEPLKVCIDSLFCMDAQDIDAVYGGVQNLRMGLRVLGEQLGQQVERDNIETTRHVINLLYLERRLRKHAEFNQRIRDGILAAQRQQSFFDSTHENTLAGLGSLYQQTVSQLGPRIIVNGEQSHLSNPDNAARIRALLLAGIRAAVLWRQAGGNRWRLIFERKKILHESRALLGGA